MISIEEIKDQIATAERKAREARAQYEFAKRHPELNSQANFDILARVHDGVEITVKSLEDLIQHPEVQSMLTVKDLKRVLSDEARRRADDQKAAALAKQKADIAEAKERQNLWREISQLLKVSDGMKDGERRKYELKSPKGEWICPTPIMRDRLQALKETSVFRGTPVGQLKDHLRNNRPEPVTVPALPAEYTAQRIRLLTAADLRKLINRYSSAAVTKRLQEYQEE